jgi:ribulose-phosphate 3-epimerase
MIEIIPAIIAKDFEDLKNQINLVERFVQTVQLDIVDGVFAPEKTWSEPLMLKNLQTNLKLDAHLMVFEPEKEIDKWINSGVKRILIHFEATKHLGEIIEKVKNAGLEIGIVLNFATSEDVLDGWIAKIDMVQFMSISQIGSHNFSFQEGVIDKIIRLRQKYPNVKIGVDGGVNSGNVLALAKAGVDFLAVGSAIFGSDDIGREIKSFKDAVS